jgi:fatty-acyl-CoA synthase
MKWLKLLYILHKMNILTPLGIYSLMAAFYQCGIGLMTLLCFAERIYGHKVALVDDNEELTYKQLFEQSNLIARHLFRDYGLRKGHKVAFLCRNHSSMIKAIFAVSRLGADIYLLNTELSKVQIQNVIHHHQFNLIVSDPEFHLEQSNGTILSYHEHLSSINNLHRMETNVKLKRTSGSRIILLTGGTTGQAKEVVHQPSLFHYLHPFVGLLTRLKLLEYQTSYIATPIFHGYGVALLLLFIALGKKVIVTRQFHVGKASQIIREYQVAVITVVPIMIRKLLKDDVEALKTLKCIASGSAELQPKLVEEIQRKLGDVLYNLYGTSEGGLTTIATPRDLRYSTKTIGKVINGVRLKVLDNDKHPVHGGAVGQFCIETNPKGKWIETGDLGYQDNNGYYFLKGRTDDMVVSGGVNVYPLDLEQLLTLHPQIDDVAVVGILDEEFGQRLKVYIQPIKGATLTKEELYEWLRPQIARFQTPREMIFVARMPYTAVGKHDKKKLKNGYQ